MIDARRVIVRPDQQLIAETVTVTPRDDRSRGEVVLAVRDETADECEIRFTAEAARELATELKRLADSLF